MTNGDVEMQKEVLTPFLINLDYLGWGSGLSPEYQAEWGFHLVNSLLELCYIESGESLDGDHNFIPGFRRDFSQFFTFYVRTDWHSERNTFILTQEDQEEAYPTSDILFTSDPDGSWREPGEESHNSNIILMMASPGQGELYQEQVLTLTEELNNNTFDVPYLPRYRFDTLIKFLLRWLLESVRSELTADRSDIPITHGGDILYSHWLSPILSVRWTPEEYAEIKNLLMNSPELTKHEKDRLLRLFQFSEHSGTSDQVIPEIQQHFPQCFSFAENRNESNGQTHSDIQQPDPAEENMEKIMENLSKIEAWVDFNSPPSVFDTHTAYMKFAVDIMNRCLYLLRIGVAASPDAETANRGYTKHRAIIVGHMVRLTKLYEGSLIHISGCHRELAHIFFRLILETAIRMEYLITSKSKKKSCRSFILASYKPEREMLQDLKSKAKERSLMPIEKRMMRSILSWLRGDGITQKELFNNKIWNVDGKNFRDIMKMFNPDPMYSYAYGGASHPVHGDWGDINLYHLKQDGHYYMPDLSFTEPDPRLTGSLTHICLDSLLKYLKWNKSDPDNVISSLAEKLIVLNRVFDDAHENTLGE